MRAACHGPGLDSSCALHGQPVLALFIRPACSVPDPKSAGVGEQPFPELSEAAGVKAKSVWPPVQPPLCDLPTAASPWHPSTHWEIQTSSCQGPGDYFSLMFTYSNVKPSPYAHGKYLQSCGVRKGNQYFVNVSLINKIWELNAFCA